MLYFLYYLKDYWSPLNVFQYITFRMGGAAITALALSLLLGPKLISILKAYNIRQITSGYVPPGHLSKQGTPTMGGLLIFGAVIGSVLLWTKLDERFVHLLIFVTVSLTAVGVYDDMVKLAHKHARGAPSMVKLAVQITVATIAISYLACHPPNAEYATKVNIPYLKSTYLCLGASYYFLAIIILVGTSNAVNLTDGLDGLATGSIIFCCLTYGIFAYVAGHAEFAAYLGIVPVAGAGEIAVFAAAVMGACLGFLWFNGYPAEIFMGDTGSLFLGGAVGMIAICVKQELLLPVIAGVFLVETLSVILQMTSYKFRKGKRIFLMTPIHHHFELKGLAEPKVTVRFWIASIGLSLLALASLKIR